MPTLNCNISQCLQNTLEARSRSAGNSISYLVWRALSQYFGTPLHTLFQVSTSGALVQGVYERAVSSKLLLNYGDFGLGTFENLDGEMVVLDGAIYQARGDGKVLKIVDDVGTPLKSPDHIAPVLKQAFDIPGPVLIGVHIDYRDNQNLFEQVNERSIH